MTKTIRLRTPLQEKEARLVEGMADGSRCTQYELYAYCADYFWGNYRGVFFADETAASEIFQNTFIAFWENIERRKIYVKDGIVMGKDEQPLSGSKHDARYHSGCYLSNVATMQRDSHKVLL